jgi:hypothetical protein
MDTHHPGKIRGVKLFIILALRYFPQDPPYSIVTAVEFNLQIQDGFIINQVLS